jgi:uncharacterized protein YpuA (DUF1002 family)
MKRREYFVNDLLEKERQQIRNEQEQCRRAIEEIVYQQQTEDVPTEDEIAKLVQHVVKKWMLNH